MVRNQSRSRFRSLPKPKKCTATGKLRWPDGKAAIEVLHAAKNGRMRDEEAGRMARRRELRHHRCSACGGFHTTSWASAQPASA